MCAVSLVEGSLKRSPRTLAGREVGFDVNPKILTLSLAAVVNMGSYASIVFANRPAVHAAKNLISQKTIRTKTMSINRHGERKGYSGESGKCR